MASDPQGFFDSTSAATSAIVFMCSGPVSLACRAMPKRSSRNKINRSVVRSEEHTSELQSPCNLVCRLLLEKINDADITGAAADVAGQHLAHPVGVAVRLLGQQRMRHGDEASRAQAALQRVMLAQGFLQRRQ